MSEIHFIFFFLFTIKTNKRGALSCFLIIPPGGLLLALTDNDGFNRQSVFHRDLGRVVICNNNLVPLLILKEAS